MFGRVFRSYRRVQRTQKELAFSFGPFLLSLFGGPKGKLAAFVMRRAKPSVDRAFDMVWGAESSKPKRKRFGKSSRRRGRRY